MDKTIVFPVLAQPKFIISASAALTATSQVAGIFGSIENALSNKRSLEYLEILSNDIQEIKLSLSLVLDKLDRLTEEIRSIIKEEVNHALLKERYIELDSLLMRYFVENGGSELSKSTSDRLDYILLFICNCENRLSYMLDFVRACEIAMLLSKGKHWKYVLSVVLTKIDLIKPLQEEIKSKVNDNRFTLLALLSNDTYVSSYAMNNESYSIESIEYSVHSDRTTTKKVTKSKPIYAERYEGEIGDGPGMKNPPPKIIVVGYEEVTETVNDEAGIAFNHNKIEHVRRIERSKSKLAESLSQLSDIDTVERFLNRYINYLNT